jgi:hypothetical protein
MKLRKGECERERNIERVGEGDEEIEKRDRGEKEG